LVSGLATLRFSDEVPGEIFLGADAGDLFLAFDPGGLFLAFGVGGAGSAKRAEIKEFVVVRCFLGGRPFVSLLFLVLISFRGNSSCSSESSSTSNSLSVSETLGERLRANLGWAPNFLAMSFFASFSKRSSS